MGVICQIIIHQPKEGHYKSGRLLKGVVKYATDKPTEFKNVTLSLLGRAKAKWIEHHGRSYTTYTGLQELVTCEVNVTNKVPGQTVTLHGDYEYPFTFYLPENLPTSHKDKISKITYSIVMKFVKPSFFSFNKVFTEEFPFRGFVDPTQIVGKKDYMGPITFGLQKKLFAPFTLKKPLVTLKAEIAKSCLIPGEQIQLSYVVTKPINMAIYSVTGDLYCYTTYTCGGSMKRKVERVQGCSGTTACVLEGEVRNLTCLVPTLPELFSLQNCEVISKEYRLLVTVRLPMPHLNPVVEMPIVLGERKAAESEFLEYVTHSLDGTLMPPASPAPPAYSELHRKF